MPSVLLADNSLSPLHRVPSTSHVRYDDSDLDTETDMPPLEAVIPKDQLKKLKGKDKKRQEVINGKHLTFENFAF